MLRKEKTTFLFVLSFLLTFGLFWGQTITIRAASPYYTDSDAMKFTPSGIALNNLTDSNNSLFVPGATNGHFMPTVINDNNGNASILKLNGKATNSVTSVWSNETANNYIDVTKKQDLSFWVYLGDGISSTDGMALVFQNDGRGVNAISKDSYGNIAGGQTLGVWGDNTGSNKTSSAIADSAIKNSWALEFDNHHDGGTAESDSSSFGDSYDAWDTDITRSLGDQHTGWNYPGSADAYLPLSSGVFRLKHKEIQNLALTGLAHPQWGWHHVMIDYNPPATKGGMAMINYSFNTKAADGHKSNTLDTAENTGQNLVYEHASVDTSKFNLGDSNKLRFGFTSSEGNRVGGNMWVVFESLPAVVQAQSTAYVVDDTSKARIDTNTSDAYPSYVEDEDQALPITKTAHPGDNLKFKYGVKYEGGKTSATNIKSTIDIPGNVTFGSADSDVIGKVTYVSADGKETDDVNLTKSDVGTDGSTLTYNVKELNNTHTSDLTAVKIELDGIANDLPTDSTSLKVPISHANFTGTNYMSDAQTDAFDIVKPADTLNITKDDPDPQQIFQNGTHDTANLNGHLAFASGKSITNTEDYDLHYSINGGADVIGHGTSADASKFSIPINGSDLNTDTPNDITVQAVYTNYKNSAGNIETIASKKIHYTVNVEKIALVATAANDNKISTLNGTYLMLPQITVKHNDGTGLEGSSDHIDFTISNPNKNNGVPTKYSQDGTPSSSDGSTGLGQRQYRLSVSNTSGLSVGENTVTVQFTDPGGHSSNILTFKIDVKDATLNLKYGDGTDGNITVVAADDTISFPLDVAYESNDLFKSSDIKYTVQVDDGAASKPVKIPSTSGTHSAIDFVENLKRSDLNGLNGVNIDADKTRSDHTVTFQAVDTYGRTSQKVTFNLHMIYNSANLTYKDNYSFGALNQSPEARIVKRTSDWDLMVNTINESYKLTASAGPLTTTDPSDIHTLAGGLIYVDPTTGETKPMTDPVTLSENDSETTDEHPISSRWADNQGILLQVDPNASAGSYSGKINWNLTDSI